MKSLFQIRISQTDGKDRISKKDLLKAIGNDEVNFTNKGDVVFIELKSNNRIVAVIEDSL